MNSNLEQLAARVATDPYFLAAALARYAQSERLDDAGVAAKLACPGAVLTALRLCRMPRAQPPFFWQDVEQIATRFGVQAEALAEVVRRGQSLIELGAAERSADLDGVGSLLAARDRPPAAPHPPEGDPS